MIPLFSIPLFSYYAYYFEMARATGKTNSKKSATASIPPTTTSTASVMPNDGLDPAAQPSSASSQVSSTPVQGTAHASKAKTTKKSKAPASSKTAPLDPNDAAALLARLAEQQGE